MPPRCYPPEPVFATGRTAERRVWEVLRDQLPEDAALLHSVAMIERAAEHEADLVVAWPGVGVAVIEVKGGHVSRRHGQWYQSSGGSTWRIKDPVVQAQDCKHVLHRLLAQYGSEAAPARSAHLVAFPFTSIGPGWSYAGCTRDMVLARNDLAAADDRIRVVIEKHGRGHAPLSSAGLESLLEVSTGCATKAAPASTSMSACPAHGAVWSCAATLTKSPRSAGLVCVGGSNRPLGVRPSAVACGQVWLISGQRSRDVRLADTVRGHSSTGLTSAAQWPDSQVRQSATKNIYIRARNEAGYNAALFLDMLGSLGGLGTACRPASTR